MSEDKTGLRAKGVDLADQKTWALLRRLVAGSVRPYLWHLGFALVCMTLVAAATALSAWLLDPVVNKVFVERDRTLLWLIGGAVLGTFLVKSIAGYAQEALLAYVGQRVVADTQSRLYRHLLSQDVALFQHRNTGTLISHFTYDINMMRQAVANALVGLGRDSLSVIFLVAVMFYQEWLLATLTLVLGPLCVWPLQQLGRRMRKVSGATQEEMGRLTSMLSESFHGIRVIKAYTMEGVETARAARLVEGIFRLTFRAARVRAAMQPIVDSFGGIAVAAVIVYGGARVIEGVTTPGAFFSFIAAALMAYQPLRALGKVNANLQEGLAATSRIFALLDRQPAIADPAVPATLDRAAGSVVFEDVRFAYAGADAADGDEAPPALDGVDFAAPAGGVTALVGPSGAGKSTVLALIPRFYDVDAGRVLVNGRDVRDVRLEDLRGALAVVGQEVVLFDDTVANNIRYGRPGAGDGEVRAAAEAAAAAGFISELPQGYDTVIGEHGLKLSGGQRQRLAIARAILRDAPILLLDEATSALDTESERQIQTALKRLMAGRTTIVIAHRLSTIVDADVIHVFDRGRVVESGDHAALLAREGLYARLHALQFAPTAEAAQ